MRITGLFIIFTFVYLSCNPSYEEVDGPVWNSLHNSKPFQSSFYHNSKFRFPGGNCDEPQCHGKLLTGGNSGAPSCYSCHDGQWIVFGVSHRVVISGYYHSYIVDEYPADRDSNAAWFSNCDTAACHSSLDGYQPVPAANAQYRYSCRECHTGFAPNSIPPPGHRSKKSDDGITGWHHYKYEAGWSNFAYCSGDACHGTGRNSTGNAVSSVSGLAGHGPSCDTCH